MGHCKESGVSMVARINTSTEPISCLSHYAQAWWSPEYGTVVPETVGGVYLE